MLDRILLTRRNLCAAASAMTLAAAFAFAAPPVAAQTLAEIKAKGVLTVGTLLDFPPYGTVDAANQPDGYDVDVAKLLAQAWGVKLELVPVTGPNRIPFLLTNKVDVLSASLAPNPERAKQVQFARPNGAATIVLYGKKSVNIKTPADLKGVRIAVARASTQDMALSEIAPEGADIRRFDDDASAMQALMTGQVDALGCAQVVANQIERRARGQFENKLVLRQQYMAIAMRHSQPELLAAVNDFVAEHIANGELNRLYRKWLQVDLPELPAESLPPVAQ